MAYYPFVPSFLRPLIRFKKKNPGRRGIVKSRVTKVHKPKRWQSKFYRSESGYKAFKRRDPDYRDSAMVDKLGNVTRIPWYSKD